MYFGKLTPNLHSFLISTPGNAVAQSVEAPEGRVFDSRWVHWNFRTIALGLSQPLTEMSKGKGKVLPRTGHEGPELYSSFNFDARQGFVVNATSRPLYPQERPGTHCTGGWVDSRAGLDGCGKSPPPTGIRSPDRPASSDSLYRLSYHGPS